jgi:hypothetical protein
MFSSEKWQLLIALTIRHLLTKYALPLSSLQITINKVKPTGNL